MIEIVRMVLKVDFFFFEMGFRLFMFYYMCANERALRTARRGMLYGENAMG